MPLALSIVPNVVDKQTVITMPPTGSAHDAAKTMRQHDISSILVVDANDQLIGIVTERDMTRHVVANNLLAAQTELQAFMTRELKTALPEDSVFDALEKMHDIKARHLPLVQNGHAVGMVSMRDLRNYIAKLPRNKLSFIGRVLSRLK